MNRLWIVALTIALLWPMSASADESVLQRVGRKLVRGAVNVATGWLEMPKQVYRTFRQEGPVAGLLKGPMEGLGMFVVRTTAGAYEVLTFPFPVPPGYQPMFQPEYIWEPDLPEVDASMLTPPSNAER